MTLCNLNLFVLDISLTWLLNVRVESRTTPRYLNSWTSSSSSPLRNTFDFVWCFPNKIVEQQTVFLVFKRRHDWKASLGPGPLHVWECIWLPVWFFTGVYITASSAYNCMWCFYIHLEGRLYKVRKEPAPEWSLVGLQHCIPYRAVWDHWPQCFAIFDMTLSSL